MPPFSPDGLFLAAVVHGHGVCLWPLPDGETDFELALQPSVWFVAFSADGKRVATIGSGSLCVWDLSGLGRLP